MGWNKQFFYDHQSDVDSFVHGKFLFSLIQTIWDIFMFTPASFVSHPWYFWQRFDQVNYYIVAPTANHYAVALGTDGAFGATLIGASSFAALFSAFLYSFWYTSGSFRSALLFSALCPFVGNLMYALAISYDSMQLAIWGRILVGFGSAEVANRQIISTCVSFQSMTRACALFVTASAVGMSIGPL